MLLAGCASATATDRPEPTADAMPELTHGIDHAGYAIFRAAAGDSENTAVSPVSIGLAFGMADAGASGSVAAAIEQAFGFPGAGDERLAAFNAYEQALSVAPGTKVEDPETGDDVTLPTVTIANRVFTDTDFEPRAEYVQALEKWFGAGAESVPMASAPGEAANIINEWINERTEGLIQDLYSADSFDASSRLAILNALYMKATWQEELDPDATRDEPFTLLDGSQTEVPLMNASATASAVAQGDNYVAAALAYAGGQHEMLVIVPDEGAFAQIREQLGPELLEQLDEAWQAESATVRIPRFEAASELDLRDVMERTLGWSGIFGVEGMDEIAEQLEIASAIHATKVIVDEEGTEAAAVTGIGVRATSIETPALEVIADQPFLYVIRDVDTGASLFVGQVLDPTN